MKLAFSKPTSSGAEFTTLVETFRDSGYDGLQLKTGQFLPYVAEPASYPAAWRERPGTASTLIFYGTLEPDDLRTLDATIAFAADVGTERVVFCHNHPREGVTEEQLRGFARQLSDIGASARAEGVAISLHHHYEQPVMHPSDFDVFFSAVDEGTVGLTIDTAHLAKSGIDDIPAFIRDRGALIDNVHLKDYANGQWRICGEGDLDLDGILSALDDVGYDGWLCIDEESTATLHDGLTRSRAWLAARGR